MVAPRIESASAKLRALADLSPDGILAADADGLVRIINHQAAVLLGVDQDSVIEKPLDKVMLLSDQEGRSWLEVNRPYDTLAITHGVPEQAWLNQRADEVLTTARLVRDQRGGPVTAVVASLRSGRGRARLDRDRSDLVATVAHELRSPLTGVKGFVQALLNRWDKLSDDQRKLMLATVNADADRLSRLIAELLDVARIDTGRLQLYPRPSSAEVLVTRVVDSVIAGTSREVRLVVGDGLPEIFADPDKFTQVITNLVENAVRHGEGRVLVTLEAMADPWEGVQIIVDDEGPGIPLALRRRVFTKFWTTGESGGSGLGMYVIGGLTRAHGGTVVIEDGPGGGARLVVQWPAEDRRD